MICDLGCSNLRLQGLEQGWAGDGTNIAKLAGTTGEDDGDGCARRLVGDIVGCDGAGTTSLWCALTWSNDIGGSSTECN